jgi:cytochrome oxidase Cu insertion factor (SCO1/SenC/PrrC family)
VSAATGRIAPPLAEGVPEDDVAALIDGLAPGSRDDLLVELMGERNPVYTGRSTNATIRMRGYAMAAFERVGLPDRALMFVIEELESGRDPYLVAAAATALRGLDARERRVVPFLLRAIDNIRERDDVVTFETFKPSWPVTGGTTTALAEIFETLAWLGASAAFALPRLTDLEAEAASMPAVTRSALAQAIVAVQVDGPADIACCTAANVDESLRLAEPMPRSTKPPLAVRFEDQDGGRVTYSEAFVGAPSIVVFFYTRCTNPNKCSLTITKLGRLQRAIAARGLSGRLRTSGITYDPAYDLPPRLLSYGANRGVEFDDHNRLFRTTKGFDTLASYFELGVNFGSATVNRHRVEAFVLDDAARVAASFTRLQWDVTDVLDSAISMITQPGPSL